MAQASAKLTYDDYLLIPDDGLRHEIIDGEHYVNPAPSLKHQQVLGNLFLILGPFVRKTRIGALYFAPADVVLSSIDVVQPDLLFISREREQILTEKNVQGAPDLAIEILSPSNPRFDQEIKLRRYEHFGVSEYWIVDPIAEVVKIFRRADERFECVAELSEGSFETPLLPGLVIDAREVFADY